MSRRVAALFLLGLILATISVAAFAQEPPERPRIGLCLAGGGARGGAHIGVLKVLEELRIPVDYIAGTSIGSIVGGLYATGMSPAEMDSAMASIDWISLFDDREPRQYISFRRKEEDYIPYFDFEMGFGKDGLKTPAGIVAGSKLIFLLRKFTLPVYDIEDFDDLPIPFRSVATSLDDGSMVVLDHGSLALSMRASMAIPGAFTPQVIDGQTLVDGGLRRNLPYDVVKDMGADIVILVDVGPTMKDLGEDLSLTGVLKQTVFLGIAANGRESQDQISDQDVLLVPDLTGIGVESFPLMSEATQRGLAVANENLDLLRRLSLPEAEYEAWRTGVRAGNREREIMINEVRAESAGRVNPHQVARQVHSQSGAPLDLEVLAQDISRVMRLGEFQMVDYSLEPTGQPGVRDLVISTTEKPWGPNYLRFGLSLQGHLDGQTFFQIFLYHRMASINRLGAEWRNQLSFGDFLALDSEFYQPLSLSKRFFVAPRLIGSIDKRLRWLTQDLSELISSKQYQGRLDLGLNISHWAEIRAGAYHGYYSGSGENENLKLDEQLGGWRGRVAIDLLDNVDFPKHGWALFLDGRLSRDDLGADTKYERLAAHAQVAATAGRTTFFGKAEGGTSFGTELPFYHRFELGGFSRLSGLSPGRLFGDDLALLEAGFYVRILTLHQSMGGNIYLGLAGEAGQTWDYDDKPMLEDLIFGGTVFLGIESLLGPVYLGLGVAEDNNQSFYAVLGRNF